MYGKLVTVLWIGMVWVFSSVATGEEWTNVSPLGTIAASSSLSHLEAGNLIDGKRGEQSSSNYWNDGTAKEYPDVVGLIFAKPREVKEICLFFFLSLYIFIYIFILFTIKRKLYFTISTVIITPCRYCCCNVAYLQKCFTFAQLSSLKRG